MTKYQKTIIMIGSILLLAVAIWIWNEQTKTAVALNGASAPSPAYEQAVVPPFENGVEMVVEPLYEVRKVRVVGKTNLPEGTLLRVQLLGTGSLDYTGEYEVTVKDGSFTTDLFSRAGAYLMRGDYTLVVETAKAAKQNSSVRAVTGSKGEKYKGPNVAEATGEQIVTYMMPVSVK